MARTLWYCLFAPTVLILGLLLIWQSLPLSTMSAALLSLLWLTVMLTLWWRSLRQALPDKGTPCGVVLVGGPAADRLMKGGDYREGLRQRWLRLGDTEQLANWPPARYRVSGLLLAIEPDQLSPEAKDNGGLLGWQQAWLCAQRRLGHPLPAALLIIGHFQSEIGSMAASPTAIRPAADLASARQELAQQWQRMYFAACQSTPALRKQALTTLSALQCLFRYTDSQLLPRLLPQEAHHRPASLVGIGWMESGSLLPNSTWQQESITASSLQSRSRQATPVAALPLPEPLTDGFPRQWACPQWLQWMASLTIVAALFLAAFSLSSAWNNQQLIRQTAAAIQAYQTFSPEQEPLRGQAAQKLQTWQAKLSSISENGIPLRLDLGLYQGYALAQLANDSVRGYHPPQPKPDIIRLDNTALFDSGKAELKPQAKLALQSVLVWIQANPGKRVLIDGYTDNAGTTASNLRLSLARTQAVKNWLVNSSTFPATHFAVQGLGDTQPLSSNDNAAGRSQNRRVEITLIQTPD